MLKNEPPVIFGDGQQSRDFIYVKQIVEANLKACQSRENGSFNVATGKSTTINQLVEIINQSMEKDIAPVYADPRPGDVKHSLAEVSKAKSLGFEPSNDFMDELTETVNWFMNTDQ